MRVFVNNVGGYVGSALAERLVNDGHEVVGTVAPEAFGKVAIKNVAETVDGSDPMELSDLILSADASVLSLAGQTGAIGAILRTFQAPIETDKKVICISSVTTWAKTPLAPPKTLGDLDAPPPEEGEIVVADDCHHEKDYRTRRSSQAADDMRTLETQIISANTPNLATCVVSAGLLYGREGGEFYNLLKDAWLVTEDALAVPNFGKQGGNCVPTLHVDDLSALVSNLLGTPLDTKYMVAVDKSQSTLEDIARAISTELANGPVRLMTADETEELCMDEPSATNLGTDCKFDVNGSFLASSGLLQEPTDVDEGGHKGFVYAAGLVANIGKVVGAFKTTNDLRPLRCVVMGPPGVGTGSYAQAMATKFCLQVITLADCIEVALALPDPPAPEGEPEEEEPAAPVDPKAKGGPAAAENPLTLKEQAQQAKEEGVGEGGKRASAQLTGELFQLMFQTKPCLNKGYVVDGTPMTRAGAGAVGGLRGAGRRRGRSAPAGAGLGGGVVAGVCHRAQPRRRAEERRRGLAEGPVCEAQPGNRQGRGGLRGAQGGL
jgi:adenylate kinase